MRKLLSGWWVNLQFTRNQYLAVPGYGSKQCVLFSSPLFKHLIVPLQNILLFSFFFFLNNCLSVLLRSNLNLLIRYFLKQWRLRQVWCQILSPPFRCFYMTYSLEVKLEGRCCGARHLKVKLTKYGESI